MLQTASKRRRRQHRTSDARQADTAATFAQADRPEEKNRSVADEWATKAVRWISGRIFGRDQPRDTVDN